MYLIRYRCISCEHVLGMVSPSKIHHDTREGAERKKAKVFGMYHDCITYVSRQRVSTYAIHPRYMAAHETLRYKKYVVNTEEYMTRLWYDRE